MINVQGEGCPKCPHRLERTNVEKDGFIRCPTCGELTGPVGPTQTEFKCDQCGHKLKFYVE